MRGSLKGDIMKLLVMAGLFLSFNSFAGSNLICSGKQTFNSPYPNAGSRVASSLVVDTKSDSGTLRSAGRTLARLTQIDVTKNLQDGSLSLRAISEEGELFEAKIEVFGVSKIKLSGKFDGKKISFPCNSNLVLNI